MLVFFLLAMQVSFDEAIMCVKKQYICCSFTVNNNSYVLSLKKNVISVEGLLCIGANLGHQWCKTYFGQQSNKFANDCTYNRKLHNLVAK